MASAPGGALDIWIRIGIRIRSMRTTADATNRRIR
jgi:hypothetical protein